MAQRSSLQRFNPVLIALSVFLVPILLYFFIFVPAQKKHHIKRDFRVLNDMASQVQLKIDELNTVFLNTARDTIGLSVWATYRKQLELIPGIEIEKCDTSDFVNEEEVFRDDSGYVEEQDYKNLKYKLYGEFVESDGFYLRFIFYCLRPGSEIDSIFIQAKFNLYSMVQPILDRPIFDDILISDLQGKVILQLGDSEIKVTKIDSLSFEGDEQNKFSQLGSRTSLTDIKFGLEKYKLFIQPLQLRLKNQGQNLMLLNWALCGMLESTKFQSRIYAISYNFIIIFMFFIIITTIGWPLIKIWQMGPQDRFRRSDMLFLIFSFFIGCPLWSVAMQDIHFYWNVTSKIDVQLNQFSDKISDNFITELYSAISQLQTLDSLYQQEYVKLNNRKQFRPNILSEDIIWENSKKYPFYEMVFWVDSSGMQKSKWSVKKQTTPPIQIAKREYFKKIKEKQLLQLHNSSSNYWLQPINSMTTGQNEAALSIPCSDTTETLVAAVMTFSPISLMQTVSIIGYGFCIIDPNGMVLFHSDQKRNLHDNFIKDCNNDANIKAAIYGRTENWISAKYEGKDTRIYLQPLQNTNWSLATFVSMNALETANLEILTIALTLIIFNVLIIIILFMMVRIVRPDYSALWMWVEAKVSGSYQQLIIAHSLLITLFLFVLFGLDKSDSFLLLFLLPAFAIVITSLKLKIDKKRVDYKGEDKIRDIYCPRLILSNMLLFLIFCPLIYHFSFVDNSGYTKFWLRLFITGIMMLITLFLLSEDWYDWFQSKKNLRYRGSYILVLVFLLLIIFVLPSIGLFRMLSDRETQLLIRHGHYNLARDLENRNENIERQFQKIRLSSKNRDNIIKLRKETYAWDIYSHFFFKSDFCIDTSNSGGGVNTGTESGSNGLINYFNSFLNKIRLPYNNVSIQTQGINAEESKDKLWNLQIVNNDSLHFLYKTRAGHSLRIGSSTNYISAGSYIYWGFGFFLFFLILSALIRVIMKRIVLLDFEEVELHNNPENFRDFLQTVRFTKHTFLCVPPASKMSTSLATNQHIHLSNMTDIVSHKQWFNKFDYSGLPKDLTVPIVLDHFEYGMNNEKLNREKQTFLEQLIYKYKRIVVLVSSSDPICIFYHEPNNESVNKQNMSSKNRGHDWAEIIKEFEVLYLQETGTQADLIQKFKAILDSQIKDISLSAWLRWRNICPKTLGMFIKIPGHQNGKPRIAIDNKIHTLCETLKNECQVNLKMLQIGYDIIKDQRCAAYSKKYLINEVLNRAYAYYFLLWSNCNSAEKLFLIQLAEEGLPNLKNTTVVRGLLRRKMIVNMPYIHLMNESFRKFIISVYETDDLKAEQTKSGWNTIKLPLLLVLSALLILLFITQQEFLNISIAVLTTLVAVIPAAIRLLSFFSVPKLPSSPQ